MTKHEQEILNEYFGVVQDYDNEFWKDPMNEKMYLEAKEAKLDFCDADRYVYLYALLGYNIGLELFQELDCYLWNNCDTDILNADKDAKNDEWKLIIDWVNNNANIKNT